MAREPDPIEWTVEDLPRLWANYASTLAELGSDLPRGTAERFRSEVLVPAESGDFVRAVEAWANDWSESSQIQGISTREIARLRDSLGALLEKLPEPGTFSRWFTRDPLSAAETKSLLAEIHLTLDLLSRPLQSSLSDLQKTLELIRHDVVELLRTAPPTWPPAPVFFAASLWKALQDGSAECEPLRTWAKQIVDFDGNGDDLAALTAGWLDAFAGAVPSPIGKLSTERAFWLDWKHNTFMKWATCHGIEVLPPSWTYLVRHTADELRADGATLAAVYRAEEPLGEIIRVKAYGFSIDGTSIRPAVVTVSAGPAPLGLIELEESFEGADLELPERLRDWRAASLEGRLESAAVETFVLYWDRFRSPWVLNQPEIAAQFDERLSAVLIENFGLKPFYPSLFQDRPAGWVQPADGTRMTTGRVREVMRPGLVDRNGELRVPARVIVE